MVELPLEHYVLCLGYFRAIVWVVFFGRLIICVYVYPIMNILDNKVLLWEDTKEIYCKSQETVTSNIFVPHYEEKNVKHKR